MPSRPCLRCGQLTRTGSYCDRHRPRRGRRNGSTRRWRELRVRAMMRDGNKCVRCGSTERLEVHHVLLVSEGGPDRLDNLQTLCDDCHQAAHRPSAA